ncbi:amidohydrolase family protein [Rhodocaloribacter litoris]|uniref:amidohydrolase family protein n=1 Tax=Rhodocaloribacter litoris TaxID=2558931 RepID=UPI0014231422|nr:amidohydrolase family protein [Rhodocaloribacter litoris]QXD16365.1 amidohydrolase family protein [Rhodocaloribacter litoris]
MTRLLALLPLLFALTGSNPLPPPETVTAFVGVHVVPMDSERVLENQTVLVRGTRIVAVGEAGAVRVPADAVRIDGQGRYLMPGLAEMHGHLLPPGADPADVENLLFLYLANGITTVRVMLGFENSLELRAKTSRGELLGPTFYMAGPGFSGSTINSPEEAEARVRSQKAAGWDLLKVFPGLTREEYDAMARTAHEVGIRFAGHVPADVGLRHALEMGQDTFDHLDGYVEYLGGDRGEIDDAQLAEVVRLTREAGAWVVPTMALWEYLFGVVEPETLQAYPELQYMPPGQVEAWVENYRRRLASPDRDAAAAQRVIRNRMRILRALHEGGAGILMGTDSPQLFSVPGFSLHRELERMTAAGMTPYDVLRTGTYNVGAYFNGKDTFGTVAVGRRADLILLEGNPLESLDHLRRPAGVMVRGTWLPRETIQERLARIAAAYAR